MKYLLYLVIFYAIIESLGAIKTMLKDARTLKEILLIGALNFLTIGLIYYIILKLG